MLAIDFVDQSIDSFKKLIHARIFLKVNVLHLVRVEPLVKEPFCAGGIFTQKVVFQYRFIEGKTS